jgi:hypothetical protein
MSDLPLTARLMRFAQAANFVGLPAVALPVGCGAPGGGGGKAKEPAMPISCVCVWRWW